MVGEYLFRPPWLIVLFLAVAILALAGLGPARAGEVGSLWRSLVARRRGLLVASALASAAASLAVNVWVLGGLPHTQDEIAYMFQARTLASGHLAVVAPEDLEPALHTLFLVKDEGRWYGKYPFGWPLVLALGVLLGIAPAVNPLLNLLAVFLTHRLLARQFGPGWAFGGTVLMAVSPFFLLMGASYLSHPLTLVLFLAMVLVHEALLDELGPGPGRAARIGNLAALLGLASALYVTVRPFDAAVLTAPLAASALLRLVRGRQSGPAALIVLLPLVGVSLMLAYNSALTHDPLLTPFLKYSAGDRPGFGPTVGTFHPEGHNIYKAVLNLTFNMLALNEDLWGWPSIGLVVVLAGLLLPAAWTRTERTLVGCSVAVYGLYFCFMGHGIAFGARYYHVLLPVYLWFTLRALQELVRRFGERVRCLVLVMIPFLSLMAASTYYPTRLAWLDDYWDVLSRPLELLRPETPDRHVVVLVPDVKIRGFRDLYDSFFSLNSLPPYDDRRIFVKFGPWATDGRLAKAFPGWTAAMLSKERVKAVLQDGDQKR